MSTSELKQRLINRIQTSDNEYLLKEVFRLLEIDNEMDDIYLLSESQKKGIEEARSGIKNGKFISNEQSDSKTDEWLKE